MPFENLSASDRESEFKNLLRGRRLVFEIGLTEERVEAAATTFCTGRRGNRLFNHQLARDYPATLVVLLAGIGLFEYEPSGYWDKLGIENRWTSAVGQAFERALRRLNLETFQDMVEGENALRYLAPILAHGGIPAYCRTDFFSLLVRFVPDVSADPTELLNYWRNRKASIQGIDRPVLRFILYGGEPALDFLGRCVDLVVETHRTGEVPNADEAGLPADLVEAYAHFEPARQTSAVRDALPRPYVQLDPWDGMGPTLELPAASGVNMAISWSFRDERRNLMLNGSRVRQQSMRLSPARTWEVDLRVGGRTTRPFVFECLHPFPVLFFDPGNGKLWRNRNSVRLSSAWVIHPKTLTIAGVDREGVEHALPVSEELPAPIGNWSEYRLAHYDLHDSQHLLVKDQSGPIHRVVVTQPGTRPTLAAACPLPNVITDGGAQVYASVPALLIPDLVDELSDRWRITARSNRMTRHLTARDCTHEGSFLSLKNLFDDWELHEVDLAVRGPLGADLTTRLTVVPGLQVQRPAEMLMPNSAGQVKVIVAPGLRVGPLEHDNVAVLRVSESATEVRCPVTAGHDEVTLRISVPRLTWTLAIPGDASISLTTNVVTLDVSELTQLEQVSLAVSTGIPGARLQLRLRSHGADLQSTLWQTASSTGRLLFNLGRFKDTLAHLGAPNPEFAIDTGRGAAAVARIATQFQVSNISAQRTDVRGAAMFACSFDSNCDFHGLEARVWSQDRPWTNPLVLPIPDEGDHTVALSDDRVPSPGRYLVEIAPTDPWNRPVRPGLRAPNTALVTLGEPAEIERHRAGLDQSRAINVLEVLLATGRAPRDLTEAEISDVAPAAVASACCLLGSQGPRALSARSFERLTSLFALAPEVLASSICRAAQQGLVSKEHLVSLAVVTIPLMMPGDVGATVESITADTPVTLADSMIRDLWTTCAPIAALVDVPMAFRGDEAAADRCEAYLGLRPGVVPTVGAPVGQSEWLCPAEALRVLHTAMELRLVRLLDIDAFAETMFEWLMAERAGMLDSSALSTEFKALRNPLPKFNDELARQLSGRRPTVLLDEGMKLPLTSLAAAIYCLTGGPLVEHAVQALLKLSPVLPRMVTQDLVLATWLIAGTGPDSSLATELSPARAARIQMRANWTARGINNHVEPA